MGGTRRRILSVAAVTAVVTGMVGIGHPAPATLGALGQTVNQANAAKASMVNFAFQPTSLTIDAGAPVAWTNTADRPHTVSDRGGTFDTNLVLPGATRSLTFTVPGTYSYFCRINPTKMNGTIIVRPGPQPAKVVRVQAVDPAREGETFRFDPNQLQVATGTNIVLANVGGSPHTLTADDRTFATAVVNPGPESGRFAGESATVAITRPGTFAFHCEIHPDTMKGVVMATGPPTAVAAGSTGAPARRIIDIVDFAFRDAQASVTTGGEVVWRDRGKVAHTATFEKIDDPVVSALDTNVIQPGGEARLGAPVRAGSYAYRCNIHPNRMRGVLVVVGPGQRDPTRRESAAPARLVVEHRGPSMPVLTLALVGAFGAGLLFSLLVRRPRRRVATQ